MKKITLFLTLVFATYFGYSQCIGTYEYITVNSTNDGNVQLMDGCNYSSDWMNITGLVIGEDYAFTSEFASDYFTFTDNSNNVIASGTVPLLVNDIAVASGRIHIYSSSSCVSDSTCRDTFVQCTSCTPPPAPDCASNPFPENGAVDVPNGDILFTWEAPTTGPTPTSYNLYAGETPSGDDYGLIGNYTTLSADITITGYDIQLYWIIKPMNGTTEATGCPVWSFTTEPQPSPPSNDNVCDAIPLVLGSVSSGGTYTNISATLQPSEVGGDCWFFGNPPSNSVWFSFVAPASGEVNISTVYFDGTLEDTQLALYSLTDCSDLTTLTLIGCDEDDDGDFDENGILEAYLRQTGLTGGQTYYIQVDGYGSAVGTFDISVTDATLSIDDVTQNQFAYFPNPVKNTLQLNAQSNIQNVSIYNMLGQEVLRTTPNNVNSTVDMSALQAGAYFVKVTINDRTETVRVIKQ